MEHKDPATTLLDRGELPNFIATNLRVLRKQAGWSQTELAERVGLNRGNIASYESGCAEPSICNLLRISNLFDIPTRDITRRDLSDSAELLLARSAHRADTEQRVGRAEDYRARSEQLRQLIDSSHQLFAYKRARLEHPCKEAEIMAAHYLQLLDLSNQLLQEHGKLLDEFDCPCG
jgi:transcriptional regulator with XRE-family HTH domain